MGCKVFFILLFTVSLWPLLWHSINFAVYTIAVSDNALANNVIVGGASLAKVFIPIWLISKTSKIPVAETLKKISFTGGGLAYVGGNQAVQLIKNNMKKYSPNNQNKEEVTVERTEVNIQETVVQEGRGATLSTEPEDFSIRESDTPFLPEEKQIEKIPQEKALLNGEENKSLEVSSQNHIESNVETNVSKVNSNESKQEAHIENNPQVHKEIRETQNISQTHNESILNEPQSHNVESETTRTEYNQQIFNEAIHREEWIEEGEEYIAPHRHKNNEGDAEL